MPYEFYNPSPTGARIGDCVIRAICKALNQTWEHTYVALCVQGFSMYDLPNADSVWGSYLRSKGFERFIIPNTCPDCYSRDGFMDKLMDLKAAAPDDKHREAVDRMMAELEHR